ncbi:hypothetical protein C5167_015164 [Papaver somniferum]|uniref:Uncharacterized protein n=1 Tax=Papaver somniferum TaxID=3469 RepID=A0A4Y7J9K6_PAPSO|nr:hypothetical protein C5167_015164 [Papaver somniferum]
MVLLCLVHQLATQRATLYCHQYVNKVHSGKTHKQKKHSLALTNKRSRYVDCFGFGLPSLWGP